MHRDYDVLACQQKQSHYCFKEDFRKEERKTRCDCSKLCMKHGSVSTQCTTRRADVDLKDR